MTLEQLKTFSEIAQAGSFVLGGILASFWTFYKYRAEGAVQRSRAELDRHRAEIAQLETKRAAKPMLGLTAAADLLPGPTEGTHSIRVKLRLINRGNTPELIRYSDSSVRASIVKDTCNGRLVLGDVIVGAWGRIGGEAGGEHLWPGEEALEEVLIITKEHGLYLIFCSIEYSKDSDSIRVGAISGTKESGTTVTSVVTAVPVFFDTRVSVPGQ